MSDEEYRVTSTSAQSAKGDPIVLRETENGQRRLVFVPQMVNNPNNSDHSVKGTLVYERKKGNSWNPLDEEHLNSLEAGEGFKVELKSAALFKLHEHVEGLYRLHEREGIPKGTKTFVPQELARKFDPDSIETVVQWLASQNDPESVAASLTGLEADDLQRINAATGLSTLKQADDAWTDNRKNPDENFWQEKLLEFPFVLSQLFAVPTVIYDDEAYVGGKRSSNQEGNLVDFLVENQMTRNAALIEIKTPTTPLLGNEYRTGAYNVSRELSGAVQQVLTQRQTLNEEYAGLKGREDGDHPDAFDPRCVVIAGNLDELSSDTSKRRSFELFRSNQRQVEVVTYDELFQKTETLIDLLEGNISGTDTTSSSEPLSDTLDDILSG